MASWLGAISRQMHTARAISFTWLVNEFDHHRPGVVHVLKCLPNFRPVHLSRPGNSAIIFTGMEMENFIACFSNSFPTILLFQMHMERIEMQSNIVHASPFGELQALIDNIDHVCFKSV